MLALGLLAWCKWEFKYLGEENGTWSQVESTEDAKPTDSAKTTVADGEKIIIYVDENCEKAQMQACERWTLENIISQLAKDKNYFEIKYTTKEQNKELSEIAGWTPVMVMPESSLWQLQVEANQLEEIKKWAKKVGDKYYQQLFSRVWWEENLCNDGLDNNWDWKIDAEDPTCLASIAITSKKCKTNYCDELSLKSMLLWYNTKVLNYDEWEWKTIYSTLEKQWNTTLPIILLKEKNQFLKTIPEEWFKTIEGIDWYNTMILSPGFDYDPKIEACETDCNASAECKKLAMCNKSDKPKVDLFVMSYCPYGTQAEKWILPSVNLLKDKIDFKVKFVNYVMHGKKEIDENTLQYCIQKEEPAKYIEYLTCFLWNWKTDACKAQAKIDENKAKACIAESDKKYSIEENWTDQTKRLGRYPKYLIHDAENIQYGVQGSPTLVINGNQVQPRSRSPKAYLDSICEAFTDKPAECNEQNISDLSYDPMFGWTQNWQAAPEWVCWE